MKYFIIGFLLIVCLASPLFAGGQDIDLWLTVTDNDGSYCNVNLYAASATGSPFTQIDGINWAIAYNTGENTPNTSLVYDFASGWGPTIDINPISFGSFDEEIYWAGLGESDYRTIGIAGTLIATIQFEKTGSSWGTVHIVTVDDDGIYGAVITDNGVDLSLSFFPSGDYTLPVQMAEMKATASANEGIILTWATESELNNAGFHVWRSEAENKPFMRVSKALIPGHGNSSSKNEYSFTDRDVRGDKTYWYKIEAVSTDGKSEFLNPISVQGVTPVPDKFTLSRNFPNPFNPQTTAGYELPEDSKVIIRVFTMLGKQVKTLIDQQEKAGKYSASWDGTDSRGLQVPSGIYFMQMQAGSFSSVRKMTLIR